MSRHLAREEAFKLVYERLVTSQKNDFTFELLTEGNNSEDTEYVRRLYDAVNDRFDVLKSIVERYSEGFVFERLIKTDCAALMIATCEILAFDDIPDKVAVNEAVELVKIYSDEKSGRFVNGVLASIINRKESLKLELEGN